MWGPSASPEPAAILTLLAKRHLHELSWAFFSIPRLLQSCHGRLERSSRSFYSPPPLEHGSKGEARLGLTRHWCEDGSVSSLLPFFFAWPGGWMLFRAFLTLPSLKPATNSISCYCKLDLFNAIGFCLRPVWLCQGGSSGAGGALTNNSECCISLCRAAICSSRAAPKLQILGSSKGEDTGGLYPLQNRGTAVCSVPLQATLEQREMEECVSRGWRQISGWQLVCKFFGDVKYR